MKTIGAAAEVFDMIDSVEQAFLDRERILQAFLPEEGRFKRLRHDAERLLSTLSSSESPPPLLGMLAGIKDIFRVDGFATRAGSKLDPELFAGPEASSVTKLKDAGALIVGKTVTTEFAYFAPGPTRNPHHPDHTPGGSSSGSAAGVAAGLCSIALGTQTIGSIIRPAAFCGVVGFKPTYDRIAKDGVIPLSPSLDHVGCFAADVQTASEVAAVLCSHWTPPNGAPMRPILGVPEGPYRNSATSAGLTNFEQTCNALEAAGYEIRRVDAMPDYEAIKSRHQLILAAEAARVHEAWFAGNAHLYAPKTAELIRRGQAITEETLGRALEEMAGWRAAFDQFTDGAGVDLWISPSAPGLAPRGLDATGDPVMNLPWTQAGLPTLSLPSGTDAEGLPFGLQVTGRRDADEHLLAWALVMERILVPA